MLPMRARESSLKYPAGVHPATSFVEAHGQRLEHVDIPAKHPGLPELLLLHEGLGSVALWRDFPAGLAAATGCRTIAYSRAGFGRSAARASPFTARFMHEEALEVLPALREALHVERALLVGHSTGASMALIHAAAAPVPSVGVVAMAPFVFVEASNVESIRKARDRYPGMRTRLGRYHDDVDAVFHGWSELWLDPAFASWNIEDELAGLRCPVLAMVGDRDEYCTPAQLERLAARARHARVEANVLADCGHAPHRDQPQVVLAAIQRFIEKLEV